MGAARAGGAVETASTTASVGAAASTTVTAAAVLGEGRGGRTNES